jgi:hypothetical protein
MSLESSYSLRGILDFTNAYLKFISKKPLTVITGNVGLADWGYLKSR